MEFASQVNPWLIALCFFAGAALYASVGHAGASGYLAVMGLAGFTPEVMRPTALILNILVASVATMKFMRAGILGQTRKRLLQRTSVRIRITAGADLQDQWEDQERFRDSHLHLARVTAAKLGRDAAAGQTMGLARYTSSIVWIAHSDQGS